MTQRPETEGIAMFLHRNTGTPSICARRIVDGVLLSVYSETSVSRTELVMTAQEARALRRFLSRAIREAEAVPATRPTEEQ